MPERVYGIDLGTTRSCIAYIDDHGESVVVADAEGRRTTPSVAYFKGADELVVGTAAKRAAHVHPELVVETIKREMGLEWAREFHGSRYSPEDVSAAILKHLVAEAERETGDRASGVVITVPASFTASQKGATREAARRAGLNLLELLPEPMAAALTYRQGDDGVLVYDLGGGTFDVTLVDIVDRAFTAVGTEGDQHLGGREWDWDLARLFAQRFSERTGVPADDLLTDPITRSRLMDRAEAAKIELTKLAENVPEGGARTHQVIRHGDHRISVELTLEQFDEATRHHVLPTIERIKELLSTTGYDRRRLTRLLLVGGSVRMPQVKVALAKEFPMVQRDIFDPHMAVARGAAIRAHNLGRIEIEVRGIERFDELGEFSSSDRHIDWFEQLGVNPSEEDPGKIEAAIDARRLEWSRQTSDPGRAHAARRNLARIPAIRRWLLDAERRRKQADTGRRTGEHRGDARSGNGTTEDASERELETLKYVRQQIATMKEHGHQWEPDDAAGIAAMYPGVDTMQVEELLKEQGIVPERKYLLAHEAAGIANLLKDYEKEAKDLYHFLILETGKTVGPETACKELKEHAQQIFLERQNTHPVRGSLAQLAMKHFGDELEKQKYDRTLARDVINHPGPELEAVLNGVVFDQHVTEEEFETCLRAASMFRVTREMAREALLARAEKEGWSVAARSEGRSPLNHHQHPDRNALMALYRSAGGKAWKRSANWGTDAPLSEWSGVVTGVDGRVTRLQLGGNNLTGRIPPALASLARLEYLSLATNDLSGSIPPEFGGLANLKHLSLRGNRLSGAIPPEITSLSRLEHLDLGRNRLTFIPPGLGSLGSLEHLDLRHNSLWGTIPPELASRKHVYVDSRNEPGFTDSRQASRSSTTARTGRSLEGDRSKPEPTTAKTSRIDNRAVAADSVRNGVLGRSWGWVRSLGFVMLMVTPALIPLVLGVFLSGLGDGGGTPAPPISGTEEEQRQLGLDPGAWRQIQESLVEKGYLEPPQVDGIPGPRTREAVAEWQLALGHQPTGYLTEAAVQAILEPVPREVVPEPRLPDPTGMVARLEGLLGRPLSPVARDANGWTDLHYAAALNLPELARDLLQAGATVDARHNPVGEDGIPIFNVVDDIEIEGTAYCQWLLDAKYGPNRSAVTPLHLAASFNAHLIVKELLKRGADVHARVETEGLTAIHLAAEAGAHESAAVLLEHGADIDARTDSGDTPLVYASFAGLIVTVTFLLDRGADVNARDNDGGTPLHSAAAAAWATGPETMRNLLDRGASVDVRAYLGTPLHSAIRGSSMRCGGGGRDAHGGVPGAVTMLLDRGADMEARDSEGNTPLHVAVIEAEFGDRTAGLAGLATDPMATAMVLLERGADVHARNDAGRTAMELAGEHEEMLALLRRYGAERRLAALLQGARSGDPQAQIDVALMYLEGRDEMDRNHAEALRWLRQGASNGQAEAAMHLALMYAAGEGVPRNPDQAVSWFREFLDAHGQGDTQSVAARYEALAAETRRRYGQLAQEYMKRFVVLEMEPTGVVRFVYSGSDPDATYSQSGREVGDVLRRSARNIRDQGGRDNWSPPAMVRTLLDQGAAAQRQRLRNATGSDISGYLVDRMRVIMRQENAAHHANLYQSALQAIETEGVNFRDIIDNTSMYAGAIKIDAEPRDARVFIDGESYGTVSDMDDEHGRAVLAGRRTIRVSREGYRTHEEIKDLRPRERYVISGTLERLRDSGHGRHQQENER